MRQFVVDRGPYQYFVFGNERLLVRRLARNSSVRVFRDEVRCVEVKPIAGTRPRGATQDEDDPAGVLEMRLDGKELAEHMSADRSSPGTTSPGSAFHRHPPRRAADERGALCPRSGDLVSSVAFGHAWPDLLLDAFDALRGLASTSAR